MDTEQLQRAEIFRQSVKESQSLGQERMIKIVNDFFKGEPLCVLIQRASTVQPSLWDHCN